MSLESRNGETPRARWMRTAGLMARLGILGGLLLLGLSPVPGTLVDAVVEGRAASAAGRHEAATEHYRRASAYHPWQAAYLADVIEVGGYAAGVDSAGPEGADGPLHQLVRQAVDDPQAALASLDRADADLTAGQTGLLREALVAGQVESADLRLTRLGVALLEVGERELAGEAFDRAVRINPAYGEALAYLAYVRALAGEAALGPAQQAVAVSPQNPTVHTLAGLVWKAYARPVEARGALTRAFELDPANPAIAVEIASTHRMEHQLGLAEVWLQEAVRLSGDDFAFRLLLGEFYVDEGYRVEDMGLPLLTTLAEEAPADAEVHAALGWAHFLAGDVNAAFVEVDYALSLDPGSARANAHKAMLLDSQGRLDEAAEYYERVVEMAPGGPFGALARRALERIGRDEP